MVRERRRNLVRPCLLFLRAGRAFLLYRRHLVHLAPIKLVFFFPVSQLVENLEKYVAKRDLSFASIIIASKQVVANLVC